jgi:hypothetical protein
LFADGKQLVPPVALALARLVTGNSKSAVFLDFFIGHLSFSGAMVNYGAAMAMTTARGRPISIMPVKHTALYGRVSGLPAASKGQLRGCENCPLKVS